MTPKPPVTQPKPRKRPTAVEEPPKLRKDGTPWVPWSDIVAERLKKREEQGIVIDREGRCTAMTSGKYGPSRPCTRWAIRGHHVCDRHGGNLETTKKAARQRLLEELDPTLTRLIEIRDQNEHMPSALGASAQILNRVLGKPDSTEKDKGSGAPIIRIGIALGGLPLQPTVKVPTATATSKVIDAETDDTDE